MTRQFQTSDLRLKLPQSGPLSVFLRDQHKHHDEIICDVVNIRIGHDLIVENNKHPFKLNLDFSRIEINCKNFENLNDR